MRMIDFRQVLQMAQQGVNPNQLAMQLARQSPAVQQAMQIVNGRTPAQIRDMAFNMARQQGVDLNMVAQNMGIQLPK